ncbi:hypothetical protein [Streptomyces sp. NPDC001415]
MAGFLVVIGSRLTLFEVKTNSYFIISQQNQGARRSLLFYGLALIGFGLFSHMYPRARFWGMAAVLLSTGALIVMSVAIMAGAAGVDEETGFGTIRNVHFDPAEGAFCVLIGSVVAFVAGVNMLRTASGAPRKSTPIIWVRPGEWD